MRTSCTHLGMLLALGSIASGCAQKESSTGALFDVGGHRLYLECGGSGAPTIVLHHGQGASRKTWDKLWPDLIKTSRACRYDRAARGASEIGPVPATSAGIVRDLHALLKAASVPPPYLMVGHQELSGVTDFGALPLYVLTAGDRTWTAPPFFPQPLKQRFAGLWLDAQTKLAARSRRSTHVVVEDAGHFVHDARPDMVLKAIRSVLERR